MRKHILFCGGRQSNRNFMLGVHAAAQAVMKAYPNQLGIDAAQAIIDGVKTYDINARGLAGNQVKLLSIDKAKAIS